MMVLIMSTERSATPDTGFSLAHVRQCSPLEAESGRGEALIQRSAWRLMSSRTLSEVNSVED